MSSLLSKNYDIQTILNKCKVDEPKMITRNRLYINSMVKLIAFLIVLSPNYSLAAAGDINAVVNSMNYRDVAVTGTYRVVLVGGDVLIGSKVERMLSFAMEQAGFTKPTKLEDADFTLVYAFDVVPDGQKSSSFTTVYNAPRTGYIFGNSVYVSGGISIPRTATSTTSLYSKSLSLRLTGTKTGELIWQSNATESGWCDQILVTAPSLISLQFKDFPKERTNYRQSTDHRNPYVKKILGLFPKDTDWGCNVH